MNFYQLNSIMNGEEPYELQPLDQEKMTRYALDPEAEEDMMKQQATMQDMEVGPNVQSMGHGGELQQIDGPIEMGVRPDYEVDGQGNVTQV